MLHIDWLGQMLVEPLFGRALPIHCLCIPGDRNQHQMRETALVAQSFRQLEAVHDRQADIQECDIRLKRAYPGQGCRPIVCNDHLVPEGAQGVGERGRGVLVVVDEQHAATGR